jgi:hypothetical protein
MSTGVRLTALAVARVTSFAAVSACETVCPKDRLTRAPAGSIALQRERSWRTAGIRA